MNFREHRGALADSMATVTEVDGMKGLRSYLLELYPERWPMILDLEPYGGDDPRIGWKDVHIVIVRGFGPVGFVERPAELVSAGAAFPSAHP